MTENSALTSVAAFQCQRPACGHVWLPKGGGSAKGKTPPKTCPKCKSELWRHPVALEPREPNVCPICHIEHRIRRKSKDA
jgi:ssDNA-binding Zn-finger/Zn-ribbon topoisomerase 1